jgi:uncharacterized protein
MSARKKPLVGLLYNPAVPFILEEAGDLVDYLEVIPERLWYDFGSEEGPNRFRRVEGAIDQFKQCAIGRTVAGHGIGLSLPSAMALDEALLTEVARAARELNFAWYSEHLSVFVVPHGSIPNAQAGLGLPVLCEDETFEILRPKLARVAEVLGCKLLLENGSIFAPIPEMEMSEPAFFNRLHSEFGCGVLLDLHNLLVNWKNGGPEPRRYLAELNPDAVEEIHLAGGDELAGFYTDSHSRLTPNDVWSWAFEFVPRFRNLHALTFEFHESYFERLGTPAIASELAHMRALADMTGTLAVAAHAR